MDTKISQDENDILLRLGYFQFRRFFQAPTMQGQDIFFDKVGHFVDNLFSAQILLTGQQIKNHISFSEH